LEREAARLRESVAALEEEKLQAERSKQLALFDAFDVDRSGGVCVQKLQSGWQKVSSISMDQVAASRLLEAHDQNQSGALEFDEFCLKRLEASLESILAEREAEELAAREVEKEKQAKLELERQVKEYYETLPGNQDDSWSIRFLSALAYLLPISDAAQLGLPLGILFPDLLPGFDFFLIGSKTFPWASFFVFIGLQQLGRQKDMPALLRFNFCQAVSLDLAVGIAQIIRALLGLVDAPAAYTAWVLLSIVGFVLVIGCTGYSVGNAVLGNAPRGVPLVSAHAEEGMGLKRPDLVEQDQEQGKEGEGKEGGKIGQR